MSYIGMTYKDLKTASKHHAHMQEWLGYAMDGIEENPSIALACIREARKERINLERMATSTGITYGDLIGRIDRERMLSALGSPQTR